MNQRLLLVLVVLGCGTAPADHNTLDSIPQAAAAAVRSEANGAEVERVSREHEGGQELYEASWREGGLGREVKVTADGRVVERERELSPADVPPMVRAAAAKLLPVGAVITYVLLMNGHYEAEAMIDGAEHEVTLAADGTRVRGDDDEDGERDDDGEDDDD